MAVLITLATAKRHLNVTTDSENTDIAMKAQQASDIIVNYLKAQADPTWTDLTVPFRVQAAILLMLSHLHVHRGDDPSTDAELWEAVGRLLARDRDPALA